MAELDRTTVDALLTTTRAVRKRLDVTRPVPGAVIEECLTLALQAPTAGDAQNWHWVVVTEPTTRRAIADVYRAQNESFARGELDRATDDATRRRFESVLAMIDRLASVPVHVLAYGLEPDEGALPAPVLYGSIFPAVWSFQLALRSRGLGTTPLYVADEPAIAALVGAPPTARLASLLPVAYFTGDTFQPARRLPLDAVVSWERWARAD